MSACCLSGVVQSGTPKGREEQLGGLETYVSEPEGGSKAKSIVLLVDIFGWKLPNTRLYADKLAEAGFYVYIPDVHEADSLPIDFLETVEPNLKTKDQLSMIDKAAKTANTGATLGPWLIKHREAVSKPLIDGFLNTVKMTPGTNKVGVVGFCWGGRYAILAAAGAVDAAYAAHPSLVAAPADLEPVTKPLSLAVGDKDSLVPVSEVEKYKDILGKKADVPTEVKVYEDQIHGFALRGDWSSDKDKKAMDESLNQNVSWFKKYLA